MGQTYLVEHLLLSALLKEVKCTFLSSSTVFERSSGRGEDQEMWWYAFY
jgi:hypothetical protein